MASTTSPNANATRPLLLDGDNSHAWCNLARIYKQERDRDLAFGAYLKAVEADPTNVPAQFEVALMYADDGLHQQAIPHFEQVRRQCSDGMAPAARSGFAYHKASLDMLLTCYEKVDDSTKAQFTREEIRVYYPHHPVAESDTAASDR